MLNFKDFLLGVLLTTVTFLLWQMWVGPQVVYIKVPIPVPISPTIIPSPPAE
jgi:hypothetical protein